MKMRGWTPDHLPGVVVLFGLPGTGCQMPEGDMRVGSAPACEFQLPHVSVAPVHFRMVRRKFRCWIQPEGEAGLWLNGSLIKARCPLHPGDIIHAGSVCLLAGDSVQEFSQMVFCNHPTRKVPLRRFPIVLGKDPSCGVILPDASVAGQQVQISLENGEYRLCLLSDSGETFLNGRAFERHELVFGDLLDIGRYSLRFDGACLVMEETRGDVPALLAENLRVKRQGTTIIHGMDLRLDAGEFVAVIGPTGSGKSTLLEALSGCRLPEPGGMLLHRGFPLSHSPDSRRGFGWVPQENVVHRELNVLSAFEFSAKLRLPKAVPPRQRLRLIERASSRLGLSDHQFSKIKNLSGGELKKVSVGVELIGHPEILFLDEPTSGLDPDAERTMMKSFRELSDSGCVVVCSTHHMQSLFLCDRLLFVCDGHLLYDGPPGGAPAQFGVSTLEGIFHRMHGLRDTGLTPAAPAAVGTLPRSGPSAPPNHPESSAQLPLLLARQWAQMVSDWRNLLFLAGQPVLVGALIAWAVKGTMDDNALVLFFIAVSTLWFGCSNGVQEIVGERQIYRRERMVGLRMAPYLASKIIFLTAITAAQTGILFGIAGLAGGLPAGDPWWQAAGLAAMTLTAASIGLLISSMARTVLQGVFLVPILMIPQIVLSGFTVPASRMSGPVLQTSQLVPLFQTQRVMDVSLLWSRKIDATTIQQHLQSVENLRNVTTLKTGEISMDANPALFAIAVLLTWSFACWVFSLLFLKLRERPA